MTAYRSGEKFWQIELQFSCGVASPNVFTHRAIFRKEDVITDRSSGRFISLVQLASLLGAAGPANTGAKANSLEQKLTMQNILNDQLRPAHKTEFMSFYKLDGLGAGLKPLGLKLDYERIRTTRPSIAEMLR